MELCAGRPAQRYCEDENRLRPVEMLKVGIQVAEALLVVVAMKDPRPSLARSVLPGHGDVQGHVHPQRVSSPGSSSSANTGAASFGSCSASSRAIRRRWSPFSRSSAARLASAPPQS